MCSTVVVETWTIMPLCILFRLEAAKDDYRIHCEELEKQLIEVQHRNDELTSLAEESRALKDELDVLRFVCVCGLVLCNKLIGLSVLWVQTTKINQVIEKKQPWQNKQLWLSFCKEQHTNKQTSFVASWWEAEVEREGQPMIISMISSSCLVKGVLISKISCFVSLE